MRQTKAANHTKISSRYMFMLCASKLFKIINPIADALRLNVTKLVPYSSHEDKIWLWSQSVPPTADSISCFDPIA